MNRRVIAIRPAVGIGNSPPGSWHRSRPTHNGLAPFPFALRLRSNGAYTKNQLTTGSRVTEPDQSRLDSMRGDCRTTRPAGAHQPFSGTYPAVPESVAAVRTALVRYATRIGARSSVVERVRLAVSEAATNVVVHAYRETREPGLIHVGASVDADELRVSVTDTGSGLRVRNDSPGLGLGLAIISELGDKVELLQGASGAVRVLMAFTLTANSITT